MIPVAVGEAEVIQDPGAVLGAVPEVSQGEGPGVVPEAGVVIALKVAQDPKKKVDHGQDLLPVHKKDTCG